MVHLRNIVCHLKHFEYHITLIKKLEEEMKLKLFYAGAISFGISIALALLNLTKIKVSFSDTSVSTMTVFPAAFFALLGLLLIYHSLKTLWRN